jgi:hypothetical protein
MQDATNRPMDADGLSDSTTRPTKRARVESVLDVSSSSSPNNTEGFIPTTGRFLKMHWQLLQALYEDDKDSPSLLSQETSDAIQHFLRDRGTVRSLEAQTQKLQHIFEEAVDVLEEHNADRANIRSGPVSSGSSHVNGTTSSSSSFWASRITGGASFSAAVGRHGTVVGMSHPSPFLSTRPYSLLSHHSRDTDSPSSEPNIGLGLVAGLVQAKVQQARRKLQRTTAPLEPLVADLVDRIETLQHQLDEERTTMPFSMSRQVGVEGSASEDIAMPGSTGEEHDVLQDAANSVKSPEDREERLARIETKLKLWKLLQGDLIHHPE